VRHPPGDGDDVATDRTAQRDQLVAAYAAALDGLLAATADLDDAAWGTPTGCPGWDVHDQLAHCVGLERRLLGDEDLAPDVEVPDLPHLTGDVGRYLERDVEARRQLPHADLVAEAQDAFERRKVQLGHLQPEQLGEETMSFFGPMRTASWLRMRLFDLASHERDIRAVLDRLDGFTGVHLPGVTEHVLRSWAKTLPTRTEVGDTVRFVLDGEATDLDLGTGDLSRAESVRVTVSATLHLSAADALALAGGRSDAPTIDALEHTGDADLVAELLAVAGVTP
jgi:uncharacterized protein (TIGR03083 family)